MPAFCQSCLYLESEGPPERRRNFCPLWEQWDPERLPDDFCDLYEPNSDRVEITGRLADNPDTSYAPDRPPTACFQIITDLPGPNGRRQTERFRIIARGRSAEVASAHLAAGAPVYVAGRLRDSPTGERELEAEEIVLLPRNNRGGRR